MVGGGFDLECRGVVKRFGGFTAVDGVSFAIPKGSFFSILGPSGFGKTTLLRIVAGFADPDGGDVIIKGASVLRTPPNRRPVNLVFQHLALFPMMSVAENIAYGLKRRGVGRAGIDRSVSAVLQRVGLPDAGLKRIDALSGGQKQRVAIARCMVLDPAVLLLDEPLGALDLKLREHMKVELKLLQQQFGTTFVYITHDQSEALVMSDRVAVMNGGRFEQVGTPQELYFHPQTAFVAAFVGENNRWRGRVIDADAAGMKIEIGEGHVLRAHGGNGAVGRGDRVEIFVRPEAVDISGRSPAASNHFSGTVENLLFNGANSRVMVRMADGNLISAALPQTEAAAKVQRGDPITLAIAPQHCVTFPAAS